MEGGRIDSSKIVEVNGPIYHIRIINEFDAFISDFENGEPLAEIIEPRVYYSTSVGSTRSPEGETVLLGLFNGTGGGTCEAAAVSSTRSRQSEKGKRPSRKKSSSAALFVGCRYGPIEAIPRSKTTGK